MIAAIALASLVGFMAGLLAGCVVLIAILTPFSDYRPIEDIE